MLNYKLTPSHIQCKWKLQFDWTTESVIMCSDWNAVLMIHNCCTGNRCAYMWAFDKEGGIIKQENKVMLLKIYQSFFFQVLLVCKCWWIDCIYSYCICSAEHQLFMGILGPLYLHATVSCVPAYCKDPIYFQDWRG